MSISRCNFLWSSASAAGVSLALDSTLSKPLLAEGDNCRVCQGQPQPIPHTITTPFGTTIHHFFPGRVEGVDPVTGHDPCEIFDFSGIVADTDLLLTGTGTDLNTGDSAPYNFHTDMRFMAGRIRAADGETHRGTFAFIWLDSLPAASPLGLHSYDPGIAPTLAFWVIPIPDGSAQADFDKGTADLHLRDICVFDAFSVSNSLTPTHPLGNVVAAVIESLDLTWSGVTRSVLGFSDPINQFSGDFFETSAAISVTARTRESTGHGFRFVSSATTTVNFAQFGRETNGVFFWER